MERAFNRALFSSLLQSVEQNFWLTFSGQGTRNIQIIGNPPRSGVLPYLNARDCRSRFGPWTGRQPAPRWVSPVATSGFAGSVPPSL
jgi:hypothetical protein